MSIRKGSLSYFLLFALEKAIDGYVRFDDFVNNPHKYAFGTEKEVKKSELARVIKRLRERGLIETEINNNEVILKLTELGDGLILIDDKKKWDGKWRIVIYDIPEDKRVVRDLFRRKLKDWGFNKWQQSIWITKTDVTKNLRKLISKLGIESWVVIIESDDKAIPTIISTAA